MKNLAEMKCVPCRGGEPALTAAEVEQLMPQVDGWELLEQNGIPRLKKVFSFDSYLDGASFVQTLVDLAEKQDHHPAILLEWRQITVSWWTHVVKGLHINDFISAAKTDKLYPGL